MELNGAEIISFKNIRKSISSKNQEANFIQIPLYQRPFKWGLKDDEHENDGQRIIDLISDYFEHSLKEETKVKDYFAGSVVSVYAGENGFYKQELVDGQQRYTTLFLINFIGYLFSVKDFISKYYNYTKSISGMSDKQASTDMLKQALIPVFDNIECHLDHLYCKTSEFVEELRQLRVTIVDSFENKEFVEEGLFDILNISEIEKNKYGELILKYDRNDYNEHLVEVLSCCDLEITDKTKVRIIFNEQIDIGEVYSSYVNALKVIVDEINKHAGNRSSFDSLVKEMLGYPSANNKEAGVKLCLIQTGNHEDAYTLFEVLNDRSLSLADLEIIKNKFFRKFYSDNSKEPEFDENFINEMDDIWYSVFNKDIKQFIQDKTASLAISYICGNNNVKDGNRALLKPVTDYLNTFFIKKYTSDIFENDFRQFQIVQNLLEKELVLPYHNINTKLYEIFNERNKEFVKVCFFVYGLGQIRVLVGLVAMYLLYKRNSPSGNFSSFANDSNVKEISSLLWWVVFASEDYKKPKELADKMLDFCRYKQGDFADLKDQLIHMIVRYGKTNLESELRKQVYNVWKYRKKNDKIKMHLAFQLIYKYGINTHNKIDLGRDRRAATIHLNAFVQLDHLEPIGMNNNFSDFYFDSAEREDIIHSIGNMVPLMQAENISKNNNPICNMIPSFKDMIDRGEDPAKILERTILDLYNNNYFEEVASKPGFKKPKIDFFNARKDLIAEYLTDIFNHEFVV